MRDEKDLIRLSIDVFIRLTHTKTRPAVYRIGDADGPMGTDADLSIQHEPHGC